MNTAGVEPFKYDGSDSKRHFFTTSCLGHAPVNV
jgi:hypothetical protein